MGELLPPVEEHRHIEVPVAGTRPGHQQVGIVVVDSHLVRGSDRIVAGRSHARILLVVGSHKTDHSLLHLVEYRRRLAVRLLKRTSRLENLSDWFKTIDIIGTRLA
jgi:hypothetical protein